MTDLLTTPRTAASTAPVAATKRSPEQGYETFLWLELIGFDNQQPDMGVRAYLDTLGFTPTGLSIFMWGPDFVHQHTGLHTDAEFPADIGAYLDCFYFEKKQSGPAWTKFQLKQLIDEFHKYGVEVYFSIFPNSMGNRFHHEWISDNPEVEVIPQEDYTPWFPMLHPLKRLKDGSFYEDFFVEKVKQVASDYGFDGIHLVDGYNHGWYQLWDAEFSDDMVDQFLSQSGVQLGDGVPLTCGLNKPAISARAKWIWANKRREWIDFHVVRWETFFRKVITALHGQGRKVASNTCWTRDPVESIYRYGIDYRRIAALGIDRFVVETCGAGGEVLNRVCRARFSVPFFHVIKATSLMTKAYVPDANLCFNNCTQDITEGWSTLRQAPAFLEREVYSYTNLYHYDAAGRPNRVYDGLNVCLAAEMEPHEWRWLHERWEKNFGTAVKSVGGLTVVVSDDQFRNELDYYIQTRGNLTYNIVYQLSHVGVPVASTIDGANVASIDGPLLIVNPHLHSPRLIDDILATRTTPVFMIGAKAPSTRPADYVLADPASELKLFVYGAKPGISIDIAPESAKPVADPVFAREAPSFFDEMYFLPASKAFFEACGKVIDSTIDRSLRLDIDDFPHGEWVGVQTFTLADGTERAFIWNDQFQYVDTRLRADQPLKQVRMVSKFRNRPITPFESEEQTWTAGPKGGRYFIVRIPPKGVGVVDLIVDHQAASATAK